MGWAKLEPLTVFLPRDEILATFSPRKNTANGFQRYERASLSRKNRSNQSFRYVFQWTQWCFQVLKFVPGFQHLSLQHTGGQSYSPRQQRFMEKRSSVGNKMDEFTALARRQGTLRECSVMCFTGTGLHEDIPDQNFSMDGFQTVRADWKCTESGKRKGVGCLLFWLTTDGAIWVILRSRNVFVDRILNFLLLDFGHIPPRYNTGRHRRSFLPVAIELAAPPVEGQTP
ncbi:mitochondrial peptide methionine sulfoxide reductase isoform X1 [Mobula birostris]|uniref:mitochondrial peptide methionine sulfoxide reductase isoform X1 n=1 Tax=Mobula birostris TaxID=1983395 RepID=UPI003B283014